MPAFSYAQAAKGLAPSTSQASVKDVKEELLDQNSIPKPSQKPDAQNGANGKPARSSAGSEEKDAKTSSWELPSTSIRDGSQDKENVPVNRRSHKSSASVGDLPKTTGESGPGKENNENQSSSARAESWDTSVANEMDSTTSDKDKGKDVEDDWEKVSIPSVAAEKELKPAPIPTVNFWQQRKEAQDAKRREQGAQKAVPPAGAAVNGPITTKQNNQEQKRRAGPEREIPTTSRPTNKPADKNELSSSQSSPPGSRGEKREHAAPVRDATSWPTPETASVEERKKSLPVDRSEKSETRPSAKSHGKNWVQMPFVPTAKFETQLPPSAAKRGGRSGRGGREGGSRGHFANNGDRNENSGSMGPPPPRQSGDQDRGRKADANRGGRASSLPAGNQRASSHDNSAANIQKPSAPTAKDSVSAQATTAAPFVPVNEVSATTNIDSQEASRSSSRQNAASASSGKAVELNVGQTTETATEASIPPQILDTATRQQYAGDRNKPSHSNYRSNEYNRPERNGPPRNREWSREKTDNAREKVESWRDREYSGEGLSRRERGSERGRGSYRARGGHAYNSTYTGGHSYTTPLPQNGFELPKSGSGEPRPRQTSQPFSMTNHPSPNRNPNRAQSIPMQMMYGQGYFGNVAGVPPALSPLQTDVQAYGMPPQMPMQPGIMSAMPYNEQLGSYAVLSMVMSQMEYYFSIDNLCKDLYLRKHMDSQGWVLLSVVANFKRIKQLAGEEQTLETLRMVCPQVKNLEFMRGQDGEERIRRQEGWKDFILPIAERFPTAQNDGPAVQPEYLQYHDLPHGSGEAMPFIPGQLRSPQAGMAPVNGMFNGPTSPPLFGAIPPYDGHAGNERPPQYPYAQHFEGSRRESATSPFSPESLHRIPSGPMQNGSTVPATNGHHRSASRSFAEESVFPDDQIGLIHIYKRDRADMGTADDKAGMPQVERALSNESQGSASKLNDLRGGIQARKTSDQYVNSLRDYSEADQHRLASRLQGLTFGSSGSPVPETPAVFTKDGQQMPLPQQAQPGHYFQPYFTARTEALQDRDHGVEGALEPMYSFWSNFLVKSFNLSMYNEFKELALEDQARGSDAGFQHLLSYYDGALKAVAPVSAVVAADLVALLRNETDAARPVFKMIRLAWRNGALNLKSRKRIQDNLNEDEKAQFDKGG
ncbi:uncharacterized protein HMPREF1541_09153 [Cyphellophora europaea CBS 101466]|uniref:HTH La-type RNA-binding domain-containing protein n=1 Tax=Cyphellophora europaea (strain CBS 101466) TaxID=1220924 RepID=W2S9H2_CYPE1|nr:uncharacterized protein HMPREF1541_09153 [Cyphellophora europaea CBS 101466]ETN45322.1 hypothetical protein HMPREF1541_09153 [Cyphellophora europaea CBS 101466]